MSSVSNHLKPLDYHFASLRAEQQNSSQETISSLPQMQRIQEQEDTREQPAVTSHDITLSQSLFYAQQAAQEEAAQRHSSAQQVAQAIADEAAAKADQEAQQAAYSNVPDPKADFLDYMEKTPEERFFLAFLNAEGLTEEEFEALPQEKKEELLDKFEQVMKEKMENGDII